MRKLLKNQREVVISYLVLGLITWHQVMQYALERIDKIPVLQSFIVK